MAHKPRTSIFVLGRRRVRNGTDHEFAIWCVETVARVRSVVLRFIVAPAVSAEFLLEMVCDWDGGAENGLPVQRYC